MTVVVTGASGHVGGNLVRALLEQGRNVRVLLHKDRRAIEGLDVEYVQGDVRDQESLESAFQNTDVVYHMAVYITLQMDEWPICKAINVEGTRNVVNACLKTGVGRLIHGSSINALSQEPQGSIVDESRPLVESEQYPPYDRSKAAAEKEVQSGIKNGLNAVILNITGVIGPYDFRPSNTGKLILDYIHRKVPAIVKGGTDWVDVRDVVIGAIKAEKCAPAGAKYLLSGHWIPLYDFGLMVEDVTGIPAPRIVVPLWLARMGVPFITLYNRLTGNIPRFTTISLNALESHRNISHAKATRELDYHPRPLVETIIDTVCWFEKTGYINRSLNLSS
ncbi:NAD-dependent epimerase/dehydratase family protein [Chloroflexota bacterium]